YLTDTGGGNVIYFAEAAANSAIQSSLRNDLSKLTPHLRIVTNNGPTSVGGGGTRRRPEAPPFAGDVPPPPPPPPPPANTASVAGKVTNSRGSGISGARVALTDASGKTVTVTTNSGGNYQINNLAAGRYTLTVSASRYSTQRRTLTLGSTKLTLNVTLQRS
ncbi:MAG: carboxypeptidase regulatory-like domain-containing protein, partial [Planctomycetaceae bacterium]|nr:carboxypeptidase regulatory-like domain-containing protein [Planctomycetaceae bacterium]